MRRQFEFQEEEHDIILTVRTLSPTKWLLLDRETGQIYQGSPSGNWDKLKTDIKIDKEQP